jgi:hypothetical protein
VAETENFGPVVHEYYESKPVGTNLGRSNESIYSMRIPEMYYIVNEDRQFAESQARGTVVIQI